MLSVPKSPLDKGLEPTVVLLGGRGNFERWDLLEGPEVAGGGGVEYSQSLPASGFMV